MVWEDVEYTLINLDRSREVKKEEKEEGKLDRKMRDRNLIVDQDEGGMRDKKKRSVKMNTCFDQDLKLIYNCIFFCHLCRRCSMGKVSPVGIDSRKSIHGIIIHKSTPSLSLTLLSSQLQ